MLVNKKILFCCFLTVLSLAIYAQPHFGDYAYEISLPTVKGDTVKLSSLKGQVVLVDFWASWCGPCRQSNRKMVKLYDKYRSKGFEILGVSLDEAKKDWAKAIEKDRIRWLQVNDPGGWEAGTSLRWNLFQIPTSYLIDKEGRVIGMDLEAHDLEKALKQLL